MGLLDGVLGQMAGGDKGGLGDIIALAMKNPAALSALGSLLSSRDSSVGGAGGLGGLIAQFQKHGLGDLVSGWISQGPNPGIAPNQIADVLGEGTLNQFASKAGVSTAEAQSLLATLLPTAVDQLTPDGQLPDASTLDDKIASLMGRLGR
jgi:uncharacterized protein YidB (DUF937 family)